MQFFTPEMRAEQISSKQRDEEYFRRKRERLLSDPIGLQALRLMQENTDNPACCRTCPSCGKVCRTTADWIRHEGTEECKKIQCENEGKDYVPPPPPKCEICDKEYKNEYCLARHLKTDAHKRQMDILKNGVLVYFCGKCEMTFKSKSNLNRHLKTKKHLAPEEDLFCSVCNKTFNNKRALKQHLASKLHRRLDQVLVCSKTS